MNAITESIVGFISVYCWEGDYMLLKLSGINGSTVRFPFVYQTVDESQKICTVARLIG